MLMITRLAICLLVLCLTAITSKSPRFRISLAMKRECLPRWNLLVQLR